MRAAQFLAIIGRGSKGSNALENTEDRAGATSEQQDNVINTVNSLDPYGPSCQLVPGNVAAGTVYAQVPTSGTGDLAFTRASTATRTNSAGTIVNVATGVPRIDYRNADGSLSSTGRLLLEPQRTNLFPNGLSFFTATGVSYDSSITASPAPGVQNATRITKNEAAGNLRYANQAVSATLLSGSSTYSLSRYFKYDGFDFQTTMEFNNSGHWGGVSWTVPINISATAITIGSPTACTATIVNMGSGWYRVTATITTGVTIVGAPTYLMRLPATLSTGQGFLTALPQLELGTYATTFIPTTTAAVTRLIDTPVLNNAAFLPTAYPFTLFADMDIIDTTVGYVLSFSNNAAANNYFAIIYTTNIWSAQSRPNGTTVSADGTFTTARGRHKAAAVFTLNTIKIYVDGVSVATVTNTNTFNSSINDLNVGFLRTVTDQGTRNSIFNAAVINRELSNAELAAITTL